MTGSLSARSAFVDVPVEYRVDTSLKAGYEELLVWS